MYIYKMYSFLIYVYVYIYIYIDIEMSLPPLLKDPPFFVVLPGSRAVYLAAGISSVQNLRQ